MANNDLSTNLKDRLSKTYERSKNAPKKPEDEKVQLGKLWDGTKLFLVNGKYHRGPLHELDFTEGANHPARGFVPKGEIWIEKMIDPIDQSFNAVHEIVEYLLMQYGGFKDYDKAHEHTNEIENIVRSMAEEVEIKPVVKD